MNNQNRRKIGFTALWAVIVVGLAMAVQAANTSDHRDESAIRNVLARFYDGWNAHDVEKMVSVYAEDIDHINVYAKWNQGKPAIRKAISAFHSGPGKNDHKTYTIEKIRFIKPDVAVIHVRSLSTVGNLGTYVMSKDTGEWLVVSFTNVEYALSAN